MSTASRPFNNLPGPVKRLIAGSAAVALFLTASAMLHPERSMAAARDNAEAKQSRIMLASEANKLASSTKHAPIQAPTVTSTRPLIGTLVGSPYFVWVYAGTSGPLYTVANREGQILATEIDAETLYERLPDVSVQTLQLQAGEPGPLMMVDPDSVQH